MLRKTLVINLSVTECVRMNVCLLRRVWERELPDWYLNQGQTDSMARADCWYTSEPGQRSSCGRSQQMPSTWCDSNLHRDNIRRFSPAFLGLHCTSLQHHGWMTLCNSCSFIHLKVGSRQDWFSSYVWIISTHRLTLDERSWGHCRQHSLNRLRLVITSTYFSSESINRNQGHLDEVASLQVALRLPEVESRRGRSQPEFLDRHWSWFC